MIQWCTAEGSVSEEAVTQPLHVLNAATKKKLSYQNKSQSLSPYAKS